MTHVQQKKLLQQRQNRERRIRAELHGTAERPRVSVARSNKHMQIQVINDDTRVTVVGGNDTGLAGATKTERAIALARKIAAECKAAGIQKVIFDRGAFRYHGRVKAVADTLREEGMQV